MTSTSLVGGVSGFRGGGALESTDGCCTYGPVKLEKVGPGDQRCPRNGDENGEWRGR